LGDQIAYADRRQVPLVVIIGPDEAARGLAKLRRLSDGHELTVPQADLPETARAALNGSTA
jgi:histidyl-tRNA synthetase